MKLSATDYQTLHKGQRMSEAELKEKLEELLRLWMQALEIKDYHTCLQHGIAAYMLSRESKDPDISTRSLPWIKTSCEHILEPLKKKQRAEFFENNTCSFCGVRQPEHKYVAGADVLICISCVDMAHQMLHRPIEVD